MKYSFLLSLLFISAACSHTQDKNVKRYAVAFDSNQDETMKAAAVKKTERQGVCFEITLWMKKARPEEAMPSHWTAAWVDDEQQYHLFTINQRNPASLPQGGAEVKNTFTGCAPRAKFSNVAEVVLTPKTDKADEENLRLSWKK